MADASSPPPPSAGYLIRLKSLGVESESTETSSPSPQIIRIHDEVSYAKLVGSLHQRQNVAQSDYGADSKLPYFLRLPFFFHPWTVKREVCLLTRVLILCLCILGLIAMCFDTWRWMRWVSCFLLMDCAVRVVAGNRGALISSIAESLTVFLPASPSLPAAPWQVANVVYFVLNGIIVILTFAISPSTATTRAANTIAAAAVYGVQIIWLLTDLYQPISLSHAVLQCLIRLGIIHPAHYMHSFDAVQEEERMAAAELHLRKTESALKHTVLIRMAHQLPADNETADNQTPTLSPHMVSVAEVDHDQHLNDLSLSPDATMANRPKRANSVPHGPVYEYAAATDPFKKLDWHPIRNIPVTVFFPTLGLAGLAEAWFFASQPNTLNAPEYIWQILAVVAGVVYCACFILYALKLYYYPAKCAREWAHPVTRYGFFPIFVTPLIHIDWAVKLSPLFGKVLFWYGGPATLACTLYTIAEWFSQPFTWAAFSPIWNLAVVVNGICALELTVVYPDLGDNVAWLWLAFTIVLWLVVLVLIIVRLIFHEPLLDVARPSVWLTFSSPGVQFVALLAVDGVLAQSADQPYPLPMSDAARLFFWVTNVLFALQLILVAKAYYGRMAFYLGYWGFSFPLTILALDWVIYKAFYPNSTAVNIMMVAILTITCYVLAVLCSNTVVALLSKGILAPDTVLRWSPTMIQKLQHPAFRCALITAREQLTALTESMSKEQTYTQLEVGQRLHSLQQLLADFVIVFNAFLDARSQVLHPLLHRWFPGVTLEADHSTDRMRQQVQVLHTAALRLNDCHPASASDIKSSRLIVDQLHQQLNSFAPQLLRYLDHGDLIIMPLVLEYFDIDQAKQLVNTLWNTIPLSTWRVIVPFIVQHNPHHHQRIQWITCFQWFLQSHLTLIGRMLYAGLPDQFLFQRLLVDLPQLGNMQVSTHLRYW